MAHVTIDWLEAPEPYYRYFIRRGIPAEQVIWDLRRYYGIRADRIVHLETSDGRRLDPKDLVEMFDGDVLYLTEQIGSG